MEMLVLYLLICLNLLLRYQAVNAEMEPVEDDFKLASKLAQSMVKDSSQAAIKTMLDELKVVKDRLVKVRRDIPERLKPLKPLLPQVR